MAAKSVENHISADPKARPEINERNCTFFFYLSYYARKVLLWVLKENGDNLFRCSVKVDNKTLVDEGAFDLDGFVDISLRGFGILPSQKCDD